MASLISFSLIVVLYVSSFSISILPLFIALSQPNTSLVSLFVLSLWIPVLFVFSFPVIAGLLSLLVRKSIKKGMFPRSVAHPTYLGRKIYGTLWAALYYFKPAYYISTVLTPMKFIVFRLFGYKGHIDFTTYPDTWIRDIPLLNFGKNTYIANRCTLGTNLCLINKKIIVDGITTGKNVMIGHLSMIGMGCNFKDNVEIGLASVIGFNIQLEKNVRIGPHCSINHKCVFADDVQIGTRSYIGPNVKIAKGIKIPPGSNIPKDSVIATQEEANSYYSTETATIKALRDEFVSSMSRTA